MCILIKVRSYVKTEITPFCLGSLVDLIILLFRYICKLCSNKQTVEWVQPKSHVGKIKKIYLKYKHPKNSISMRLLGGARNQIRAGLATAQSGQYHTNAELKGVARPTSGIRARLRS